MDDNPNFFIKNNKNINDISINIKCYSNLSNIEVELIGYIINNKSNEYIKELLLSNQNKNYKNKSIQFIKLVENNIKKYGLVYIDWIKEINFYELLIEWSPRLLNVSINPFKKLLNDK